MLLMHDKLACHKMNCMHKYIASLVHFIVFTCSFKILFKLYKFTLRRIQADALKALRCQGNLGPQRVLHLLKETIAKENTADQVIEQQTTTNQKQNE